MVKIGLLTQNLRGAKQRGLFAKLLHEFSKWRDTHGINVLCAQEHNLDPKDKAALERLATSKGMTAAISFAPANNAGEFPGGVMLIFDNKMLTLKSVTHNFDGYIAATAEWGGTIVEVAGVYAPSTNDGTVREDFFASLKGKVTKDTIAGGDYNCVPDVTLDVESRNPLAYPNKGAAKLAETYSEVGLVDERRNQLGNEHEPTRKGIYNGRATTTRIDGGMFPPREG